MLVTLIVGKFRWSKFSSQASRRKNFIAHHVPTVFDERLQLRVRMAAAPVTSFSIKSMVRGYHDTWDATIGEELNCRREISDPLAV